MRCSNCGQDVEDGLKFCTFCGTPMQAQAADGFAASDAQETAANAPYQDPGYENYQNSGNQEPYPYSNGEPYQSASYGDPYQSASYGDPYQNASYGDPYQTGPYGGVYQNAPYGGGYQQKKSRGFSLRGLVGSGSQWNKLTRLSTLFCLILSFLPMVWANSAYASWHEYYEAYETEKMAGGYANLYSLSIFGGGDYFIAYLFLISIIWILVMQYLKHPWLSALGFAGILRSAGELLQIHYMEEFYDELHENTVAYFSRYSNVSVFFWILFLLAAAGMFCALMSGLPENENRGLAGICKCMGVCGALLGALARYYPIVGDEASAWDTTYKMYINLKLFPYIDEELSGIRVLIFFLCLTTLLQIILLLKDHPLLSLIGSGAMLFYIIIVISCNASFADDVSIGIGVIFMALSLLITTAAALLPVFVKMGGGSYSGGNTRWNAYADPNYPGGSQLNYPGGNQPNAPQWNGGPNPYDSRQNIPQDQGGPWGGYSN